MSRGVQLSLFGSIAVAALIALAGCSHNFYGGEREAWRHDAEVACVNSGAVKDSPERVRISAISGPGICGADFPIRVSALGESAPLGYDDEPLRPPGAVPDQAHAAALAVRAVERLAAAASRTQQGRPSPAASGSARPPLQVSRRRSRGRPMSLYAPGVPEPGEDDAAFEPEPPRPYGGTPARSASARRPQPPAAGLPAADIYAARPDRRRAPRSMCRSAGRAIHGHRVGRTGRSETSGDAGLPYRLRARSMDHGRRAAGSAALVPSAGGRDQTNIRLFMPRHERQSERAHFRARLRQRARHRRVRARRRPQDHRAIWLARLARGTGLSARRAACRLRKNSPPCWRPAPTSITTITFMSI